VTSELDAMMQFASFSLALWGALLGRKGQDEADIVECNDAILDMLGNADRIRTIEAITDRNLRDQLTIEQAEQLHREREAARHWQQRN